VVAGAITKLVNAVSHAANSAGSVAVPAMLNISASLQVVLLDEVSMLNMLIAALLE
jgi:hypothetical protein